MRCYGLTPWEFRPFVEEHPKVAWALLQALGAPAPLLVERPTTR